MSDLEATEPIWASEWEQWAFGEDLRLGERSSGRELAARTALVKEESLETIIALNLDQWMPGWALQLVNTSFAGWSAADIAAVDGLGCLHLFELKYGSPAGRVLEQLLGYMFSAFGDQARQDADSSSLSGTSASGAAVEEFALRIAGVWSNTRTANMASTADEQRLAPSERRKSQRARLSQSAFGEHAAGRALQLAESHSERLGCYPRRRVGTVTGVHLHFVAPGMKTQVEQPDLTSFATLRARGVRISFWDVRLAVDSTCRTGVLIRREVAVAALNATRVDRDPFGSVRLLQAVQRSGSLAVPSHRWLFTTAAKGTANAMWVDGLRGTNIGLLVEVGTVGAGGEGLATLRYRNGISAWVRESVDPLIPARLRLQRETARDWLLEVAAPSLGSPEAERTRSRLDRCVGDWQRWLASDGDVPVTVWRSAELLQVDLTVSLSGGEERVAAFFAKAIAVLDRLVEERSDCYREPR